MVFGTGEFPRNYLDPTFFAREAGQLKLSPEVEATVEHLVTQLQSDMEASTTDLLSLLKKGEGLSDRQVTQTIQTAQKTADARFEHFLSQTKQFLLNQLGGQHAQAIDKFVADMKEEVAPRLDMAEQVRQDPTLREKALPKSVFELPGKTAKKGTIKAAAPPSEKKAADSPLQPYLDKLQQWESQFPQNSAQYQFADAIIQQVKNAIGKGESLDQLVADIQNNIYQGEIGQFGSSDDIFMKFTGLTTDQAADVDKNIFGGKLGTPSYTQMDKMYADAAAWLKTPLDQQDFWVAQALCSMIQGWTSSDGFMSQFIQTCKSWESEYDYFKNSSPQAQTLFEALSGINPSPLVSNLDQLVQGSYLMQPGSPQYQLANAIMMQCFSAIGNKQDINALIGLIQNNVFTDPKGSLDDIYIRFFGVTTDQVANIVALFPGLKAPAFTQMDTNYQAAQKWLADPNISAADKQLAQALLAELVALGSNPSQLGPLKDWSQNFLQNSIYINATPAGQALFRTLTGAATDPLESYLDNVRNWQAQFKAGSPEYLLAAAFIKQIEALMGKNKTLQDLINAIKQNVYTNANGDDLYMQFFGVSTQEVDTLVGFFKDGPVSLQPPSFTQMDTLYQATEKWYNDPKTPAADKQLAQALLQQMSLLGSDPSKVGPLKDWAQKFTSDPLFTNASSAGQTLFCQLTGATMPPAGLSGWDQEIARYLAQRNTDFATLLLELGIPPNPMPKTQAQWDALAGFASTFSKDMERAERAGTQQAWSALAAQWGLPGGNIATIQKEAQDRLTGYKDAGLGFGDQSAIKLFTQVFAEIKSLEKSGGSLTDLQKWAKGINLANFPGLSKDDLTEFQRLLPGNL